MKAVLFGATRGMGRSIARILAQRGERIHLLGIGPEDLERSARDLEVLGAPSPVEWTEIDLLDASGFAPALDAADQALGGFDTVVMTAALFGRQEDLEDDTERAARLLTANFTNTVLFCEEVRRRLLARGGGRLCVFSSVAGDRGRKPVILYGATKGGLSRYLEGLDHKFHAQGLRVLCVKPGFVKTGMTAGLRPPPFAGEPDDVARRVVRALDRGKALIYVPPPWRYMMLIIRHLPRFVMRRIGF
ncbi:MAG: SDR family NAD(P)-dependent oxidoreductase [Candidatus Sumerlaeia bacterium]|nr:SDR family NAD(P)-dependent oxidoreductase [Candidatus Sumerlaeia bacterium]